MGFRANVNVDICLASGWSYLYLQKLSYVPRLRGLSMVCLSLLQIPSD